MNANDVTFRSRPDGAWIISLWEGDKEKYTGFGQTPGKALRDLANILDEVRPETVHET